MMCYKNILFQNTKSSKWYAYYSAICPPHLTWKKDLSKTAHRVLLHFYNSSYSLYGPELI